jgi:hypothetical protein
MFTSPSWMMKYASPFLSAEMIECSCIFFAKIVPFVKLKYISAYYQEDRNSVETR